MCAKRCDVSSQGLLDLFFLNLLAAEQVGCGSGNEHGGDGTDDHAKDHGEGEAADAGTTEDEDEEQHDERGD